jgi:hypothetical protein
MRVAGASRSLSEEALEVQRAAGVFDNVRIGMIPPKAGEFGDV